MKLTKGDQAYILRWAKRIKAIDILGGCCSECQDDNVFHLDFHHPEQNKECSVNQLKNKRWSLFETEILKCRILCRNCHSKLHKNHKVIKEKILQHKGIWHCETCGFNENLAALDLHHKDPYGKCFTISNMSRGNGLLVTLEVLFEEVDKCKVLCSNCHAIHQIDVDRFKRLETLIYERAEAHKELRKPINKDLVADMKKSGMCVTDIAKELKCAKSTISRLFNMHPTNLEQDS